MVLRRTTNAVFRPLALRGVGMGMALASAASPPPAYAQTSFVAPDGRNRYPGVTIFCPSGTGVAPCAFGGSGSTGGAVTVTLSSGAVSASNRFPVSDAALDGLISGGALSIGGTVALSGTPTVTLGAGTSAIGSLAVTNFPAVQPVSGAVSQSGNWSVGLAAGNNAIGAVSVSNLPLTQAVSAATLPLPGGAATAASQAAPLAPVAPGAATATASMVLGCVSNTTLPAFTAGQQGAVPCDASGRPYVVTVPSANNVPVYLQAVSTGGASIYRAINAASSTMAAAVKAGSGMVYGYEACNSGTSAAYLRLFASGAAPTVGTSVPQVSKLVPAGSCQTMTTSTGLMFNGGIALDVTAGSLADSDTAAVASANSVSVEVYFK